MAGASPATTILPLPLRGEAVYSSGWACPCHVFACFYVTFPQLQTTPVNTGFGLRVAPHFLRGRD